MTDGESMKMLSRLTVFFGRSFRRKILFFNITLLVVTNAILFLFLNKNFQIITDFALAQNTAGTTKTVEGYLEKYAQEKAASIWLQLKSTQDDLSVIGKTAQKIVDHYDEFRARPDIFAIPLFQIPLQEVRGALTSDPAKPVDALIPPPLVANPKAKETLTIFSLLNLSIDAVYQANDNNAFLYFVGDTETPVTLAYPNIRLAENLDDLNALFWQDYFAQNVNVWRRWYTDPALQARIPSPITVEPPYLDAAGQGMVMTMFYPLWNKKNQEFAGVVAADITLNKIIQNILSIRLGHSGFAFLMNGKGEIIAMPEEGYKLLGVDLKPVEQGELLYYIGSLGNARQPAVQTMTDTLLKENEGVYRLELAEGASAEKTYLAAFASLPSLSDNQYQEDRWRVVVVLPEAETYEVLYKTDATIRQKSATIRTLSAALVSVLVLLAAFVSVRFSNRVTYDLQALARAAKDVSAKDYNIHLALTSHDEIGQLGQTFEEMAQEIRDYTANLEAKVQERTLELQRANEEITLLNERLKDENLRLSAELDVARRLQLMVLPPEEETQAVQDLDIAGYMRPADEVGGDYYDVLQIGNIVFIGIGDVTGHGLPAGVIMLMAQTAMLALSQSGEQDMRALLSRLNHVLYRNILRIQEDKNMTLALLRYHDRQFQLVGQHEMVIICRTDGQIEIVDTLNLGFPVGLADDIEEFIAHKNFALSPGDVLLLYTDGVTEAENTQGEMFELDRLTALLCQHRHLEAKQILERILEGLYAFIGEAHIYEDISMVVVKQK